MPKSRRSNHRAPVQSTRKGLTNTLRAVYIVIIIVILGCLLASLAPLSQGPANTVTEIPIEQVR